MFEHLPGKVAPCGLTARRHHGTKTGTGDDQDDDSTIDGVFGTAVSSNAVTRQADVRVRPQSRTVGTGS